MCVCVCVNVYMAAPPHQSAAQTAAAVGAEEAVAEKDEQEALAAVEGAWAVV